MRRTLIVLAVVLAVLLVATPGLVAAKGPGGGGGQGGDHQGGTWFNVYGTIDSLDEPIIYLLVGETSRLAGETITVYTDEDTRFTDCASSEDIGFGDLLKGDIVRISGTVDGDAYYATAVILNPSTEPEE